MTWKAIFRRNHIAIALWAAMSGLFLPLFGLMFYSSFTFLTASFYTLGVTLGSFLLMGFIPAFMYESLRILAAILWKKGYWLSVAERRENRFGKKVAKKIVPTA